MTNLQRLFQTALAMAMMLCTISQAQAQWKLPRLLTAPVMSQRSSADPADSPGDRIQIPVGARSDAVQLSGSGGRISLTARDGSLKAVLSAIASSQNLNLVFAEQSDQTVNITLSDVSLEDALDAILSVSGLTWTTRNGIISVTSRSEGSSLSPSAQGRVVRMFELDFTSATDLESVVQAFLSPAGQSSVTSSTNADNRRTKDVIIVEDLPEYVERIEKYIAEIDQPPRQVMIEAYVLQVDLGLENRHGVNFEQLSAVVDPELTVQTRGFANGTAPQGYFMELDTGHIKGLLEALKTTTDAKTLASPKVMTLNGQESRIQIGEQLGFRVLTVTETSTLENVQFLDTGVVLRVTPRIARDGRVLMRVKPEVSSGQVNPDTGLPEEETTELETDVMLSDGQGLVIGGLIKEENRNVQSKVPWIGDIPKVGAIFQRRQVIRNRSEVIIALVPHVMPFRPSILQRNHTQWERATTPLLQGPLHPVPRPWEPTLGDPLTERVSLHGLIAPCHGQECTDCAFHADDYFDYQSGLQHPLTFGDPHHAGEPMPMPSPAHR